MSCLIAIKLRLEPGGEHGNPPLAQTSDKLHGAAATPKNNLSVSHHQVTKTQTLRRPPITSPIGTVDQRSSPCVPARASISGHSNRQGRVIGTLLCCGVAAFSSYLLQSSVIRRHHHYLGGDDDEAQVDGLRSTPARLGPSTAACYFYLHVRHPRCFEKTWTFDPRWVHLNSDA